MKKLYSTLVALAITATASFAQINLKTTMLAPTANQTITVGTPFNLKVEFKVVSGGPILTTDTLWYSFTGAPGYYGRTGISKNNGDTVLLNINPNFTSAPNGTLNFCAVGFIERNSATFESDTSDNVSCKSVKITGGTPAASIAAVIYDNNSVRENMSIVPNPANGEVRLGFKVRNNGNAVVRVLDVTGREVIRQDYGMQYRGASDFRVNVSNLTPGMYMVEMVQDNIRAIGRLTKQ